MRMEEAIELAAYHALALGVSREQFEYIAFTVFTKTESKIERENDDA